MRPSRQALLRAAVAISPALRWPDALGIRSAAATTSAVIATEQTATQTLVEVPLSLCGGAYCVTYAVDGQRFRAVVDTGSPFLLFDGTCAADAPGRWGCYRGDGAPAGLADSELAFAGQNVLVQWRRGDFVLHGSSSAMQLARNNATIFGIVRGSRGTFGDGAIFFGLVKERGSRLGRYPTLLEQTAVASMRFDFMRRRMALSTMSLIDAAADALPIVDLRLRPSNAPDLKYACKVSRLLINGRTVPLDAPTVAIVDTGTTGLTLSQELFDSRPELYAERAAAIRIELPTERGEMCALEASIRRRRSAATGIPAVDVDLAAPEYDEFPIIVTPVPIRWGTGRAGTPYVLFVGLAFLWQRQVTIDVDARRLTIA